MSISIGSVSNSEARVSSKCKEAYEQIEEEIKASGILHIDETSHYNKGKKQAKELRRYIQYCMIKISYILEAKGASRTVKGIIKYEPMMWTFLDDPGNIPLTKNHVE